MRFSFEGTAKPGYLRIDGWAGRHDYAVMVIGETPKKYRIRAVVTATPLAGRRRSLNVGEEALVPKHAISWGYGD